MKLFTEIITESNEVRVLEPEQLDNFIKVVSKSKAASREYLQILQDTKQLGLLRSDDLERIINGSTNELKSIAINNGGPMLKYEEIKKLAAKTPNEIKGLPQFMTDNDYNDVISGKKDIGDITMDLETEKGRERCTRQYAPLVTAIAAKYRNSGLDWNGLISAGYMGLTKAMNDYHKSDEYVDIEDNLDNNGKKEVKKQKGQTFKQYAGWRIRFQILNDINELSRTVKITQYEYEKNKKSGNTKGNFNTVWIDQSIDDEGQTLVDRMTELSNDNDAFKSDAKRQWEKVYKLIDGRFSTRTASIFYKAFGLHDYKQMKQVDIAKEMHITGAAVSMSIKEVMKFLQSNKQTMQLLQDLLSIYTESLIMTNTVQTIMDAMITDDVFIMLQECTKWSDRRVFNNAIGGAVQELNEQEQEFILQCLENGINFIDEHYDGKRPVICGFLESVYPTECIRRKSDIDIINMMTDISDNFKYHNIEELLP